MYIYYYLICILCSLFMQRCGRGLFAFSYFFWEYDGGRVIKGGMLCTSEDRYGKVQWALWRIPCMTFDLERSTQSPWRLVSKLCQQAAPWREKPKAFLTALRLENELTAFSSVSHPSRASSPLGQESSVGAVGLNRFYLLCSPLGLMWKNPVFSA